MALPHPEVPSLSHQDWSGYDWALDWEARYDLHPNDVVHPVSSKEDLAINTLTVPPPVVHADPNGMFMLAMQLGRSFNRGGIYQNRIRFIRWMRLLGRVNMAQDADLRYYMSISTLERDQFAELFNQFFELRLGGDISIRMCTMCNTFTFGQLESIGQNGEDEVCRTCYQDNFTECATCNSRFLYDDMHSVQGDHICESCMDSGDVEASTCEACGYYFYQDNMVYVEDRGGYYCQDHKPREASVCKPTHLAFEFPALCTPQKSVKNDEVVTVTVAHGEVSSVGMAEIRNLVYRKTGGPNNYDGLNLHELATEESFDRTWQTREGNFPKRLAKHMLTERSMKLTEELMAEIGNIAKAYTSKTGKSHISLTRNLNLPASQFCNDGSCWWTDYATSRCEAKAYHTFGVRGWATEHGDDGEPTDRAWLIPLAVDHTSVRPRFEGTHVLPADAYVLFNSYGMEVLPFSRIVAGMTGKSYKKITFRVDNMYVNGELGVLIAEQSVCDAINVRDGIRLASRRKCTRCR